MKNHAAVAHAWANKTRESGKSGTSFSTALAFSVMGAILKLRAMLRGEETKNA